MKNNTNKTPGDTSSGQAHKWYEDLHALLLGSVLLSVGVVLYMEAQVLTSGLAGLSLLINFGTQWSFGLVFFCLNIPFYVLSLLRMGLKFTLKTFFVVTLISILSRLIPNWMDIASIDPIFAAIAGGIMFGLGIVSLLRHRAGVGGTNILAQFLQDRGIMRAGYVQLILDLLILGGSFFILPWKQVLISILGAVIMNLIIAINHKPGRYLGYS